MQLGDKNKERPLIGGSGNAINEISNQQTMEEDHSFNNDQSRRN
jgi:hypothetical protein